MTTPTSPRWTTHAALGVGLVVAALAPAACSESSGGSGGGGDSKDPNGEQAVQPIDRMLIGKAAKYPADPGLRARNAELDASQKARRAAAWEVVARAFEPVGIAAPALNGGAPVASGKLPRFQTFYSQLDFAPMFDKLFRGLSADDKRARAPFGQSAIDAIFPWNATYAMTLASWTADRYQKRIADIQDATGVASLGKGTRSMMSPAFVEHLFKSYDRILKCLKAEPDANADPTSAEDFTNGCLAGEFPVDAATVKLRWVPGDSPMATYDTTSAGIEKHVASGNWGDGDGTANPTPDDIYTMRVDGTRTMRLAGLHVTTKELRDWMWITLWWSPEADADFGADRPDAIRQLGGPWKNYKMCVVTAFDEQDADPQGGFGDDDKTKSLGASLAAARKVGGAPSWCSNPYIEIDDGNAKSNCIGCHQHGGTGLSTQDILADGQKFPENGRTKLRKTFLSDYTWVTRANMELAKGMDAKVDALTPDAPTPRRPACPGAARPRFRMLRPSQRSDGGWTGMAELEWIVTKAGGETRVALSGEVTEQTDFRPLLEQLPSSSTLELAGVVRMNSCGVREWLYFIRDAEKASKTLTLERCSVPFVQQMNMIASFVGRSRVVSVMAPFLCPSCRAEAVFAIDLARDPLEQVRTEPPCPQCKAAMVFDDLEEAYFSFRGNAL